MIGDIPLRNDFQPSVVTSQPMGYPPSYDMAVSYRPPTNVSILGRNVRSKKNSVCFSSIILCSGFFLSFLLLRKFVFSISYRVVVILCIRRPAAVPAQQVYVFYYRVVMLICICTPIGENIWRDVASKRMAGA